MKITTRLLPALLILTVCLCACSNASDDKTESNADVTPDSVAEETVDTAKIRADYDKALAYIVSTVDTEGMTQDDQDENNGESLYHSWLYEEETENSDFPMEITLDGLKMTIGTTTVDELRDAGLSLSISEENVGPDTTQGFSIEKDDKFTSVGAANNTGADANIYELAVSEISTSNSDFALPYSYADITEGSNLKAVVDALGIPNSSMYLSCDSMGTEITLGYTRSTSGSKGNASDYLTVYLRYDADKNTAVLNGVTLSHTEY